MSTITYFLDGEIRNIMRIPPLIWSYVEYRETHFWDWKKLVLTAEWSYFRVVLIAGLYYIFRRTTVSFWKAYSFYLIRIIYSRCRDLELKVQHSPGVIRKINLKGERVPPKNKMSFCKGSIFRTGICLPSLWNISTKYWGHS